MNSSRVFLFSSFSAPPIQGNPGSSTAAPCDLRMTLEIVQ
jgi:hypothetical protein